MTSRPSEASSKNAECMNGGGAAVGAVVIDVSLAISFAASTSSFQLYQLAAFVGTLLYLNAYLLLPTRLDYYLTKQQQYYIGNAWIHHMQNPRHITGTEGYVTQFPKPGTQDNDTIAGPSHLLTQLFKEYVTIFVAMSMSLSNHEFTPLQLLLTITVLMQLHLEAFIATIRRQPPKRANEELVVHGDGAQPASGSTLSTLCSALDCLFSPSRERNSESGASNTLLSLPKTAPPPAAAASTRK